MADLKPVLKKMAESQGIKTLNLSVSGAATMIRYVSFPTMNEEELRQALKFEGQKHIPFAIESVSLDSYILKPDLPDNKMLVLLVAVKKDALSQRLKSIEEAGLKANIVDIDSIALINAFNFNYYQEKETLKNKAAALLNVGAAQSNLNIIEGNIPRLSRDIFIAGNNFTQKIADTLGIDFKAAEDLKVNPSNENAEKAVSAVESVLSGLASEIRTSFDYYESQCASSVIKIFLSGGGAKFPGLNGMLANLLGIDVEYWDPLKQINIARNLNAQDIKTLSAQLGVAVGLALRR